MRGNKSSTSDHAVTFIDLICSFLLFTTESMLDSFDFERAKRSSFQYEMGKDLKKSKAETSLKRAKEFVAVFRELIK